MQARSSGARAGVGARGPGARSPEAVRPTGGVEPARPWWYDLQLRRHRQGPYSTFTSNDALNVSPVGGSTSTQNLLPGGRGFGTSACVCQLSVVSSSAFDFTDPSAVSVPTQNRTALGFPPVMTTSKAPSPPGLTGASVVATSFSEPTVFSPSG